MLPRPALASAMGAAANFGFLLVSAMAHGHAVTVESWRWMMVVAGFVGAFAYIGISSAFALLLSAIGKLVVTAALLLNKKMDSHPSLDLSEDFSASERV